MRVLPRRRRADDEVQWPEPFRRVPVRRVPAAALLGLVGGVGAVLVGLWWAWAPLALIVGGLSLVGWVLYESGGGGS